MVIYIRFSKVKKHILILIMLILCGSGYYLWNQNAILSTLSVTDPINIQLQTDIQQIFDNRNKAILVEDIDFLTKFYNIDVRTGLWAYEHELNKIKYLNNWMDKQSATFSKINSKVFLRKTQERKDGYLVNVSVTSEYEYQYNDLSETKNSFTICTYHSILHSRCFISMK